MKIYGKLIFLLFLNHKRLFLIEILNHVFLEKIFILNNIQVNHIIFRDFIANIKEDF